MKKLPIFFIVCVFTAAGYLYPQGAQKLKVVLAKPKNLSAEKSSAADKIDVLLYKTTYNFTAIIPFLDVMEPSKATNLPISEANLEAVSVSNKSDFIVYWSYTISGPQNSPKADIRQQVWSLGAGKIVWDKTYSTTLDVVLIDTIDVMMEDSLKQVLNLAGIKVGFIQFADFKIGQEKYDLWINSKHISKIEGEGFAQKLKVLADQDYNIELVQGLKKVTNFTVHVAAGEIANVSYTAHASIRLLPFDGKDSYKQYLALIDKKVILEGEEWKNILAGKEYLFELYEMPTNMIVKKSYYLTDGQVKDIQVYLKGYTQFYLTFAAGPCAAKFYDTGATDEFKPGFTLEFSPIYYPHPKWWFGGYVGLDMIDQTQTNNATLEYRNVFAGLQGGYIFVNRQQDLFNMGVGLKIGYGMFNIKQKNPEFLLYYSDNFQLGLFVFAQLAGIRLNVEVYTGMSVLRMNSVINFPVNIVKSDIAIRLTLEGLLGLF
ncbi:MAG: hypothetical protein A2Y33_03130 [Spirochaetes bacterium GWF1_51_8]|nr:MAG: hypothetical protein A2Y33_03130 [Spirochaetes bacterium GWF1_51_8]